jgi:hypothetical protein
MAIIEEYSLCLSRSTSGSYDIEVTIVINISESTDAKIWG